MKDMNLSYIDLMKIIIIEEIGKKILPFCLNKANQKLSQKRNENKREAKDGQIIILKESKKSKV